MCNERRATFQKTEMAENGTVHPCFSINLSRAQIVVSIAVSLATLFGSIVGGIAWAERSMQRIALEGFSEAANAYYKSVIPERNAHYERIVALRIAEHRKDAEAPFEERMDNLASRLSAMEAHIGILVRQGEHQQEVNEELLRAARNGGGYNR